MRELVLQSGTWSWDCSGANVIIKSPDMQKHVIDLSTFSGLTWDSLERGYWKGCGFQVTPSRIKEWIENNFIE